MNVLRVLGLAAILTAGCDGGNGSCYVNTDCDPNPETPCMDASVACLTGACHAAPYDLTCVSGHVKDNAGCPVGCQSVVACTEGACYFANTDATGFFTAPVERTGAHDLSIYFPGSDHHSPFCLFTDLCDGAIRLCTEFVLYPAPTAGVAVPPNLPPSESNPLPADVRVEAADGAVMTLHAGDELYLPFDAEPWMALSRFPTEEHLPCFIDPARPPASLYVVTPIDVYVLEPGSRLAPVLRPASLDLPNTTGLPAGSNVDIYILGGLHPQDAGLLEGEWSRSVGATVSADGTRIQTADGEGIPYLTWFGVQVP